MMVVAENREQISKLNEQTLYVIKVCYFLRWIDMYECGGLGGGRGRVVRLSFFRKCFMRVLPGLERKVIHGTLRGILEQILVFHLSDLPGFQDCGLQPLFDKGNLLN